MDEKEFADLLGVAVPASEVGTPEHQKKIDNMAAQLIDLRSQVELAKAKIDELEDAIAYMTEDEPGEVLIEGAQYDMFVERSELWKWDADIVEAQLPTLALPDFVKAKYTIDKKKFQGLTVHDQAPFLPALTRKPGSPKIKIQPKK